jgi:hypothetical protein
MCFRLAHEHDRTCSYTKSFLQKHKAVPEEEAVVKHKLKLISFTPRSGSRIRQSGCSAAAVLLSHPITRNPRWWSVTASFFPGTAPASTVVPHLAAQSTDPITSLAGIISGRRLREGNHLSAAGFFPDLEQFGRGRVEISLLPSCEWQENDARRLSGLDKGPNTTRSRGLVKLTWPAAPCGVLQFWFGDRKGNRSNTLNAA